MNTELAHIIDAQYSVIPSDSAGPMGVLQTAQSLVQWMSANATGPSYISNIQGRQYPRVEWWTAAGAALGLFPFEVSCVRHDRQDGYLYEAAVEIRKGNMVVGRGSAICTTDEKRWGLADEYAVRSMAITRATGKAYRLGLSFLAVMSGLEATPAEEVPPGGFDRVAPNRASPQVTARTEAGRPIAPTPGREAGRGGIYVTGVEEFTGETNGKLWTKYTVTLSDGQVASTFDATMGAYAQECADQQLPVEAKIRPASNPKFKPSLESITESIGAATSPASQQATPTNPVDTTIRSVDQRNSGDGVVYVAVTDAGRFGTTDAALGAQLILMQDKLASLEWAGDERGMKLLRVLDIDASDLPF